jgi:hypothetical protein
MAVVAAGLIVTMRMSIRMRRPPLARTATLLQRLRAPWREQVPMRARMRVRVHVSPMPMLH